MHVGCLFTQRGIFSIPRSWILLDLCLMRDTSNNPEIVSYIRNCSLQDKLTAYTNGGEQQYN